MEKSEIKQRYLEDGYSEEYATLVSKHASPESIEKSLKEKEWARTYVSGLSDENKLWLGAYASIMKGVHPGSNYFGHRTTPEERRIIWKTYHALCRKLAEKYHPDEPESYAFEYYYNLDHSAVRRELIRSQNVTTQFKSE